MSKELIALACLAPSSLLLLGLSVSVFIRGRRHGRWFR